MCNMKGWDIIYGPDDTITIEPHFCRTYDDCGSVDRLIQDAAKECAEFHDRLATMWRNGTHPTLQYYNDNKKQNE